VKLRVYAYAGCGTCRKALKFLTERKIAHEVIPIREQPPTPAELRAMQRHTGGELRRLFNTSGQDYRAMKLGERLPSMSEDEALALLAANGNLVKRPFAMTKTAGVVGFKSEEWERFLASA
jgi:arsenate reductase